jgi:tetratricopeptide (TPR) repeat protein
MARRHRTARPIPALYYELGQALAHDGRRGDAVAAYRQAVAEVADDAGAGRLLTDLGDAFRALTEPSLALHSYLGAARSEPEVLGDALEKANDLLSRELAAESGTWILGEWAPAMQERDGLGAREGGEVAFFLGRVELYRGGYAAARERFEQALAARPDDARALEGLGEALWQTGELEQALPVLEHARAAASKSDRERVPLVDGKRAQVLAAAGRYDDALALIRESYDDESRFADVLLAVQSECELALGEADEALATAERALARRPDSVAAQLLRARALIVLRRYDEATAAADTASQIDPSNSEPLVVKAQVLIEGQTSVGHGVHLLHNLAARGPAAAADLEARGRAIVFPGRTEDGDARHFLARVLNALGRREEALAEVQQALALGLDAVDSYPEAPAQALEADLLSVLGRREEAAASFYAAGLSYYWRNDFPHAVDQLRRAAEGPAAAGVYRYLSEALLLSTWAEPDRETAVATLQEAVEVWDRGALDPLPDPDESWTYVSRGRIPERLGELGAQPVWEAGWESIAFVERSLVLSALGLMRWTNLARLYNGLGLNACGLDASARAVEVEPGSTDAWAARTSALAEAGRLEEALAAIDGSGDPPQDAWSNAVRAWILVRLGKHDDALPLIDGSIAEEPDNLWYRDVRGLLRWLLGRPEQAREDYEAIWSHRSEPVDAGSLGVAAYELDLLDDVRTRLEPERDGSNGNLAVRYLGYAAIRRGELEEGERLTRQALDEVSSLRTLEDVVEFELVELRERVEGDEALAAVDRLLAHGCDRREEFEAPTALAELSPRVDGAGPWTRVGVTAGLARLHLAGNELDQAEACYSELRAAVLAGVPQFPEAALGLARVKGARGLAAAVAGAPAEALDQLRASLALRAEARESDAPTRLVTDLLATQPSSAEYHALVSSTRLLERRSTDGAVRVGLRAARAAAVLERHLGVRRPVASTVDPPLELAAPLPIALGLDTSLFPDDAASSIGDRLVAEGIPAVRERIRARTGITIPGVRIRSADDLTAAYSVFVYGLPVTNAAVGELASAYETLAAGLEAALTDAQLRSFVGVQETSWLLDEWTSDGDAGRALLRTEAVPNTDALVLLARVLRALVGEGVSIGRLEPIVRAFGESRAEGAAFGAIVERARLAVTEAGAS